jgi:hypothetical protein
MTGITRSTSDRDLVKVAYAHDQTEAEFLRGLLHDARIVLLAVTGLVTGALNAAPESGR